MIFGRRVIPGHLHTSPRINRGYVDFIALLNNLFMNYEFERHMKSAHDAGNDRGVRSLQSLQNLFNQLRDEGVIAELPRETKQIIYVPIYKKSEISIPQADTDKKATEVTTVQDTKDLIPEQIGDIPWEEAPFGTTLAYLRKREGFNQAEFARMAGISTAAFNRFERLKSRPPIHATARKIIAAFGWTEQDPRSQSLLAKLKQERAGAKRI